MRAKNKIHSQSGGRNKMEEKQAPSDHGGGAQPLAPMQSLLSVLLHVPPVFHTPRSKLRSDARSLQALQTW